MLVLVVLHDDLAIRCDDFNPAVVLAVGLLLVVGELHAATRKLLADGIDDEIDPPCVMVPPASVHVRAVEDGDCGAIGTGLGGEAVVDV